MKNSAIPDVLQKYQNQILQEWTQEQTAAGVIRESLIREADVRSECQEFLRLLVDATRSGNVADLASLGFRPLKEMLAATAHNRTERGFTPSETATFVFSLKRPLFSSLRREFDNDPPTLFEEIWRATELLDKLGLYTAELYQQGREAIIARQQAEMLELSTPVVQLWTGILALPLIGTLDSNRTQVVMESLLQRIVETNSEVAIIDITGVPTVDTLVAQHLMKTVAAARLMGVECIISGVRPQIAQTIVHLGVSFADIPTKSTLAGAFRLALRRVGANVMPEAPGVQAPLRTTNAPRNHD